MASVGARLLVITPTYNEADSLERVIALLLQQQPDADVLVVDDSSPDGTGALADALAEHDPRVHVLHRSSKTGLGGAYLDGFAWALDRGYDVIVQMDADGSHPASALPAMLERLGPVAATEASETGSTGGAGLDDALPAAGHHTAAPAQAVDTPGLVIGSRWVAGGTIAHWPRHREWLSRAGNSYARAMLGLPVRDTTAGYRVWRADALRRLPLDRVVSRGYCFQVDLARRAQDAGIGIDEVPITFIERTQGRSKMSSAIVVEAMLRVTWWGLLKRFRRTTRA
ncbi:polyprenol monophosphomannose synthase [Ruicaihuangia caeni]|uniref:polyprenol monophosphomannose synthase n=1 Tax=Ruicaihuangia caeni TaxID=3042517 RepID=UPI00338FF5BF